LKQEVLPVCLGEGRTPLIEDRLDDSVVFFKLEFLNPTGSFKDRGYSPLLSLMRARGITEAVEDSSGNAGASFAAYSACAGIAASVYIPDTASGPKREQIEAHGAKVVQIRGPRSNAGDAVIRAVTEKVVYASHAYLPFVISGYATIAYELFEQLEDSPGTVICPVGQGGLLLGLYRGFKALKNAKLIKKIPQMVGVQASGCAPLRDFAIFGNPDLLESSVGNTIAEGIRVKRPVRVKTILTALEDSQGFIVVVDEEDILPARDELAKRGFYVEPTSAVVWPALLKSKKSLNHPIVIVLTGSGLKYRSDN
jgi:threonine synthase